MNVKRGFFHCEFRLDSKTNRLFLLELYPYYLKVFGAEILAEMFINLALGEVSEEVVERVKRISDVDIKGTYMGTITHHYELLEAIADKYSTKYILGKRITGIGYLVLRGDKELVLQQAKDIELQLPEFHIHKQS
jgi:hypothetical protein